MTVDHYGARASSPLFRNPSNDPSRSRAGWKPALRGLTPVLIIGLGALASCGPASPPAPAAPAPVKAVATPAPPAKMATMICRNSQTGAKVECGTPNAVMVGIKEN